MDVRRSPEWKDGHIRQAVWMPLDRLGELAGRLDKKRPVAAICAGGYRSSIATSLLERLGFEQITNVVGGMTAWTGANHETVTG